VLTIVKIVSVLVVIGVAFFSTGASAHPADPIWPAALNGGIVTAFLAALAAALWAYDGLGGSQPCRLRSRRSQKNFPRALLGGVSLVAVIYLLFSAACLRVLPFDAVANSSHIASDVVEHIAGHGARTG